MSARLAFVEDTARLTDVPLGFDIVALDPFVALAAPSAISLDAHLDDAELEALGEVTFERVDAMCAAMDASARWHVQQLKELFDGLLVRALGASRLAESVGVREALLLVRAGSLSAEMLPSVLERAGARVRSIPAAGRPATASARPSQGMLAGSRVRVRRALRRRRPRILCLDEQYNLPALREALRARGADPLLWLPPTPKVQSATVRDDSALQPLLRIAGVDLWPGAQRHLTELRDHTLFADAAALRAAAIAIARDRPDALLASTYASPLAKAAATAARAAGVPSIVMRHGELGIRDVPLMRFNDLDVVDHALCWGSWEAAFIERRPLRPVETQVVGAPMIEQAATRAPSRAALRREFGVGECDRVAMLVTTSLSGEGWYAGRSVPFDLSHARHQIGLAEALISVDGLRVFVKEQADDGPLAAWGRTTGPGSAIDFLHGRSFAELVNFADVTVLDFPSTTLVQALCGTARVVVVRHPITAWEPGVLEHLEHHGVRVVAPKDLAETVLREHGGDVAYSPDALEPLAASGPGTAAGRAAEAVLEIATRRRR
ncbi:MAG TPA: hypothetical protein VFM96_00960 [Gaiellaceae bacterium]|nr:hypothetical protein [Gaiellaceae bacterium]